MANIEDMAEEDNLLYIGVVGYSDDKFDQSEAKEIIEEAFDDVEETYVDNGGYENIVIVSGLTKQGIPKIAYEIADEREYYTMGVAPQEANDYEMYDVDSIIWNGEEFGDESKEFIDSIDLLIKVGGGEQSEHEFEMAEEEDIPTLEYELASFEE